MTRYICIGRGYKDDDKIEGETCQYSVESLKEVEGREDKREE